MAGSEFDARAMASAILAKVRAAHLVEADARAQLPDTERVRFRDEDRSIRSVEATLLTADDWAKLEKSGSLPNSAVLSDRSVDVKGEHGKVRFRDLAVLIAQACEVYDYYGQSAVRFERAAATMQIVLDFMHFMLPATRQVPPTPGASTRKKLAEIKGRKLAEIVHTYLKAYKSDRPHQGDGALDSAAAAGADIELRKQELELRKQEIELQRTQQQQHHEQQQQQANMQQQQANMQQQQQQMMMDLIKMMQEKK